MALFEIFFRKFSIWKSLRKLVKTGCPPALRQMEKSGCPQPQKLPPPVMFSEWSLSMISKTLMICIQMVTGFIVVLPM